MAANYGKHFSTRVTPQSEKAKVNQKKNNAGGFTFTLDKWARLDRWLILGAEGGTYYVGEKKLTKDNAKAVMECLKEDGIRTVNRIVEISDEGRAPKNDPAIFALAMAAGDDNEATRKAALLALPKVCRIGTHLFHFARDVENFRRWGRGLRSAISRWYNDKTSDRLAYDVIKYQQRDGWAHRDLIRLAHVVPATPQHGAVLRYATSSADGMGDREVKRRKADKSESIVKYPAIALDQLPRVIQGFELAKAEPDSKKVAQLITDYRLTREMVPTTSLNSVAVWDALLKDMPLTAMVRNLGKMTNVGLLTPMSDAVKKVISSLNVEEIKKARLHPLAILVALMTYKQGRGDKGSLTWTPIPQIVDALDQAFYLAFKAIEPTGKNTLLAIDVSGSMDGGLIAGMPNITPRIGAAAMSMVTARTEASWSAIAFTSGSRSMSASRHAAYGHTGVSPLSITPNQRLDEVVRTMQSLPFGGTDCALPMIYAQEKNIPVDTFIVYTDNETWAGNIHPHQALRDYRQSSGRNAKLIVVGFTATEFTIADPDDAGMMDVVGFDTAAPAVMADFARA